MKNKLIGRIALMMTVMGIGATAIGVGVHAGQTITLKGSDTMLLLGQRWAEKFMSQTPGVTIQVTGGGSGVGIAALINGSTDICQASRAIRPSEIDKLKERFNSAGTEIPVARDGITVYVNEENTVNELTMEQLKGIYVGKITNWQELGGPDARIIVYGRENSSGTYAFFKEHVLDNEDFAAYTQTLPGTAAVVNAVARDKNGIGYGGAAYAKGVRRLKIKKDASGPAYEPSLENVSSGAYPLSRELYWYFRNKPTGETKQFVDFVLSPEGQKVVSEVGYFPVK